MEYYEEIPLKREKDSRRNFNFIEKIEKDLRNYKIQKDNLRMREEDEEEENEKEENFEEKKEKKQKLKNIINTNIFTGEKKILNKVKQETQGDNLEILMSLNSYDIFSYARHNHYKELEKLFLEGISPDSKDQFGNTLLIVAAQNNNKRILKICLRYGAQINMQNLMGNTALHFAKQYGYSEIFEYLIIKGADPNIKNLRGIPAREGLYNKSEEQLFLGKGLIPNNSKEKNLNNKFNKYDENIINKIIKFIL